MKYIVSFNDETQWSCIINSEDEAMSYAKQFRNIHDAKVYKCVEIAHFDKKKVYK